MTALDRGTRVWQEEADLVRSRLEELLTEVDPSKVSPEEALARQFDAGLAWVDFDPGSGGLGVDPEFRRLVRDELDRAGFVDPMSTNPVGYGQAAGAVHHHGTPEQRQRWLRDAFTMRDLWCQLFSEPGAGSDVAGLGTRAQLDGDVWVVNGQKVWSSAAKHARWAILLGRTHPELPKHRGLTFFVLDMQAPGVTVQPIREITGAAHFNEVFLDDVVIPDENRIGPAGKGWNVSMDALRHERSLAASFLFDADFGRRVLDAWAERAEGAHDTGVRRHDMIATWVRCEVARFTVQRLQETGLDGAIAKLLVSELRQSVGELLVDLAGIHATVGCDYTHTAAVFADRVESTAQDFFLGSRSATIAAGTSEIMRNIIGERVLGLPGEPRVDKSIPWRDTLRN